jgi:predicted lipoprotein with Yx(FWY)xxD motif
VPCPPIAAQEDDVTKLRVLVAAAIIGALALTATVDASASTATARHRGAEAGVQAKKKKKKKAKKKVAPTIKTGTITAGTVLVGPDGRTLYMFDKDTGTTSACAGPCATIWPAFEATGTQKAGAGLDQSKLTAAMQADGRNQVVYAGHLLYYFSGDTVPGDAKGLGIPTWHAVSPEGAPVGGA